jgi:hypothetical protein
MLDGQPGQAIAASPSQEGFQFTVAAGNAGEELQPQRSRTGGGRNAGELGAVGLATVSFKFAGPEVHASARRIQQPGIAVKLICAQGQPAVRPR